MFAEYSARVGYVANVAGLVGALLFNRYTRNWKYRAMLISLNLVIMAANLFNMIIYLRKNLEWGIPDEAFVIGEDAFSTLLNTFTVIPHTLIISQVCPKGYEAISFAIVMGASNLGGDISYTVGAVLLKSLGIEPTGAPDESSQFERLWEADLIASLLTIVTIILIPFAYPDCRMTDDLEYILLREKELAEKKKEIELKFPPLLELEALHTRASTLFLNNHP